MKNKLIITSLLTVLGACSTTQNTATTMVLKEIDGIKVYTYDETKECGIKNKNDDFMQICDKKTGEFLNGIIYNRYDDKDDVGENIRYYKDGYLSKHITKKNNVITEECKHDIDIQNNLFTYTAKDYFDNGKLRCERSGLKEYTTNDSISGNRICYYINGVVSNKYTMNRTDGYVDIDYDPNGKMIIKGTKPYVQNLKSDRDSGIEEDMIDKWTRYDADGKLYTGKVTYYFDEEPEIISSVVSLKNGKRDGETHGFPSKKDAEKYDEKELVNSFKDGVKVKSKTIFKDEKHPSSETYYVGDNEIYISNSKENNSAYVSCRYKGHDTSVNIKGAAAKGFVKLFEQDTTKSLCPDVSTFVK